MMLDFDTRGHLKPYQKNHLTIKGFKDYFVSAFEQGSTRQEIFESFKFYLEKLQSIINSDFHCWINGSFVTNKVNPRDIDVVFFINYQIIQSHSSVFKERYLNKNALKKKGLDIYIVRIFPEEHKDYNKFVSDSLYWEHWFTKTKKNRAKKSFPKGFVEISIGKEFEI